jgi:hypothetical protein
MGGYYTIDNDANFVTLTKHRAVYMRPPSGFRTAVAVQPFFLVATQNLPCRHPTDAGVGYPNEVLLVILTVPFLGVACIFSGLFLMSWLASRGQR